MKHFKHEHPLVLSKYINNSPPHILCYVCNDPILINSYMYHCSYRSSITTQDSPCTHFFLHKTCAELPMIIQHHRHIHEHLLRLECRSQGYLLCCKICYKWSSASVYKCTMGCYYYVCLKCAYPERELNHPAHIHTLTLLPIKALHLCGACGTEGNKDFSYLCTTCIFWIHKSCANAPATLTHKDHHNDHPLVLAYSLPEQYLKYKWSCTLCSKRVYPFYWLYYCADCRYFAHVRCALSAPEPAKDGEENDDRGELNAVHFPVSENELYQLIQQFANKFTISSEEKSGKADVIRECRNGHALTLFDDFNSKSVVETNSTSDKIRICDGCVLPLLSTPDPFYGCVECNFFLHNVCAAELPREIQHAFHPKKEPTRFTRCCPPSKPSNFYNCLFCWRYTNGIKYLSDKYDRVDTVCAALPSKIKHDSHRHSLTLQQVISDKYCRGCAGYIDKSRNLYFGCEKCDNYYIDIKCALKPGTIKHRWDEHEVNLMYPPVKGHPHDFDCEFCSQDINPNTWFYHCSKCDTSFHADCIYPKGRHYNIKYGGIVRDDSLHQHNLKFTIAGRNYPGYKCGRCGRYTRNEYDDWKYECESCKFSVCSKCSISVFFL